MSSLPGTINASLKRITPECANMSKVKFTMSIIQLIFVIFIFVVSLAAIFYNYVYKRNSNDATDATKKKQAVGALTITSTIASTVVLLFTLWDLMVANKLKSCIESAN